MKVVALILAAFSAGQLAKADQANPLVTRAVARHSALQSGRLTYREEFANVGSSLRFSPLSLSFCDDDYLLQSESADGQQVRAVVQGTSFRFDQHDAARQGLPPTLTVWQANRAERNVLGQQPIFAGSFWFTSQAEFVGRYADEFRLRGTRTIGGIKTKVCELEVSPDHSAMAFVEGSPVLAPGGVLRLYIAPALGHVLPLVEYVSDRNTVEVWFVASSFTEASPGLWLPKSVMRFGRIRVDPYLPIPALAEKSGFTQIEYDDVNRRPAVRDFMMELPAGTLVVDRSTPKRYRFRPGRTVSGGYVLQEAANAGIVLGTARIGAK